MRDNQPVSSIRCHNCHAVLIPKAMIIEVIAKLCCPRCGHTNQVMVKSVERVPAHRFDTLYGATIRLNPASVLEGARIAGYGQVETIRKKTRISGV